MVGFFYSLQHGLLANMMVIHRFQPVLLMLLAPLIIGERVPPAAALVVAISFAAVVLVVQPSAAGVDRASVAGLIAAACSALAHLTVRRLSATEHPLVIVLFFGGVTTLGGAALAAPIFVVPNSRQLALLIGAAVCATGGQLLLTMAYARDHAPMIAAASYCSVIFGALLGLIIWNELPNTLALVGGALILAAGVTLVWTHRGGQRQPYPP
jgi:drug/metabolite transporter (DMT)-like permease